MKIVLPIPDRAVSPNATRGQSRWAAIVKSKAVKKHRAKAKLETRRALYATCGHYDGADLPKFDGYSIAFYFKTAAYRDDDNAEASCKAYRDGIAEALGMNDRDLKKAALSTFDKDKNNPRVEITLKEKQQ